MILHISRVRMSVKFGARLQAGATSTRVEDYLSSRALVPDNVSIFISSVVAEAIPTDIHIFREYKFSFVWKVGRGL